MTWHTAKYGDLYSEFVLCLLPIQSAHTQQWTHTHTVNTHPEQWPAIYSVEEQLGVRCLAQGYLSRGIEGGRERCTFTFPTYNSCRPETQTRNICIASQFSNHLATTSPILSAWHGGFFWRTALNLTVQNKQGTHEQPSHKNKQKTVIDHSGNHTKY